MRTTTKQGRGAPEHEQPAARKVARSRRPRWPQARCRPPARSGCRMPKEWSSQPDHRQSVLGSPLDARYTFQSFIEGPSNRVAFAAARAVAEQSSNARFNPLFLHATVGLGKTHLLQAIAAESLKQNPQARVVYLTAEYFMWRFATAIRDNNALTLEGAVARHRPADHRRHAVPAGQVDPERVLPPDQHAARQRQAGGGGGRPAAVASWNRSSRACARASTAASRWKCRRPTTRCGSPC